jgi:cytochrome c oxidase subunit 3
VNSDESGSSGQRKPPGQLDNQGSGGKVQENVLPFPRRVASRRQPVAPNAVVGMTVFIITELMMFAGFMSAHTISRAAYRVWPPIGQPRLPAGETLLNSVALLASGVLLYVAYRSFKKNAAASNARTGRLILASLLLGTFFVVFQGVEWAQLLREGLTMTSSTHGAFFYLIIGLHALHAIAAIMALGLMYLKFVRGKLQRSTFLATQIFWLFVVGVWPVLYLRVYL